MYRKLFYNLGEPGTRRHAIISIVADKYTPNRSICYIIGLVTLMKEKVRAIHFDCKQVISGLSLTRQFKKIN